MEPRDGVGRTTGSGVRGLLSCGMTDGQQGEGLGWGLYV